MNIAAPSSSALDDSQKAPARPSSGKEAEDVYRAAKQFESFFVQYMLNTMSQGSFKSDLTGGGGFANETYNTMFNEKIADQVAESGGIGLAPFIARSLGAPDQAPPPPRSMSAPKMPFPKTTIMPIAPERDAARSFVNFERISSAYGPRTHPIYKDVRFHHGWDLPASVGTDVKAVSAGVVTFVGEMSGFGGAVEIRDANGLTHRYGHMQASQSLQVGQNVAEGQRIGIIVKSGVETGPHLHYEIRKDSHSIDPATLFKGRL